MKVLNVKSDGGFPVLGWLVNWKTSNGFSISRQAMIDALQKVNIGDAIASDILPKNAAIRAIREATKGKKDHLHRKVADTNDTTMLVIAKTEVDSRMDASFDVVTKGGYDKVTKKFIVQGQGKAELENVFETKKKVYASDQFRSIVLKYVKRECNGITYLETGNVYFVPNTKKDQLTKLIRLFEELGDDVSLVTKEEIDVKSVRSVMWDVTVNELKENLKRYQKEMEDLDENALTGKMLDVRLKRYKDLKTKADMFAVVLQGSVDDINKELNKLTATVKKKVVQ